MENPLKRDAEAVAAAAKKVAVDAPKTVQEVDVGITEYINSSYKTGGGFFGTLKQRYSDFQVFEIGLDSKVVRLTDLGIDMGPTKKDRRNERRAERPDGEEKEEEEEEKEDEKEEAKEKEEPKYTLTAAHRERLLEFISEAELQEIEGLFSSGGNMETKSAFGDKSARTQLHQLLRQAFQGKLETLTSGDNTFKVALAKGSGGTAARRNNYINHVDERGVVNYGLGPFKNYLHFTVYKENRETMEVASTITKFLRVPNKSVKYAGTKDRRGVTCQKFSIHKGKVARVTSLNKGLRNAVLGSFSYEDKGLDLGDLQGNHFQIAIRDVRTHTPEQTVESVVADSFASLQQHGFINYFGLQRFGTFSISTHALGIHLLKDDWQGAAELILSEQDRVVPDSVEARRVWADTRDAAAAAKLMPRRCSAEHSILSHLAQEKRPDAGYTKNQYFRAVMQIPRNLRLIYVHAYQSYIWNLVASKRIAMFGTAVQAGDLVMVAAKSRDSGVVTEMVDGVEFAEDVAGTVSDKVRALTQADVDSGRYSIFDVVLPSPGFDVVYPANQKLMEVYEKAMGKDGLDPHSMGRRVKEFSLAGSYRPLMGRPTDLSYQLVRYKDATDTLMHTDLEMVTARSEGRDLDRVVQCTDPDAQRTAVILEMRLGVSSYATMALREFMKADTSRLGANFDVKA